VISVTILAKNSGRTLASVLAALEGFDEVLVADTGSTDNTREIAREFPHVRLVEIPFEGFGKTHNRASALAKNEWILSVDSDEVMPQKLKEEIFSLLLHKKTAYSVARKNFYRDKWIWSCGWWPDRVVRLYNRSETQFSDRLVHEAILTQGIDLIPLQEPLHHTPFLSISDFLQKLDRYSSLAAKGYAPGKALVHGLVAFFRSYLLKRGIFQGYVGFEISLYNALSSYYKYLKVADDLTNPKERQESMRKNEPPHAASSG
jgi:glycosyltransferase involved in cell wall biosynthesis